MTMSKYYQPTLDDVVYGLEYEYINFNKQWIKRTLERGKSFDILVGAIDKYPELSRIKYLDGDDIMSLGFEIANDEGNTYKSLKRQLGMGTGDDKTLFIQHEVFPNTKGEIVVNTHIWWRENRGDEITMFEGSVKNISELKRILRQIHADGITKK